jgi:hypothetical protein
MILFFACKRPGRKRPWAHARLHARTGTHACTHRHKNTRTSSLARLPLGHTPFCGHRQRSSGAVNLKGLKNLSTLNPSGLQASRVCSASTWLASEHLLEQRAPGSAARRRVAVLKLIPVMLKRRPTVLYAESLRPRMYRKLNRVQLHKAEPDPALGDRERG